MNQFHKKDPVYDAIVVGAGLSGLVVATALIKKGLDVCVLESGEFPGGHSRSVYSPLGLVDNGLKFFPDTEEMIQALVQLKDLLTIPFDIVSEENNPVTFQGGELKPFVGFGKEAPDFHKEVSYFLGPKRLRLTLPLGKIVADLAGQVGGRFFPAQTVTRYVGQGQEIRSVLVNGQKNLHAHRFIHAASPRYLSTLLPDEILGGRTKQKIAKATYWTILGLDIFHEGLVSDRTEMHLLNGTTQDDLGPCVGLFHSPAQVEGSGGSPLQHSQWMTFLDHESGEDPEVVGAVLRKMKRQIKRAYPKALEKVVSERIGVAPLMEAELDIKVDVKRGKLGGFGGVENLWVAHGSVSGELNLLGSLRQAFKVSDESTTASPHYEKEIQMLP